MVFRLDELFYGACWLALSAKIAQVNHKTEKFSVTHTGTNKERAQQQLGMAVPPKGTRIIFETNLKTFTDAQYSHFEPNSTAVFTSKPLGDRQ
ncbi:MAG: hypothetical protein LBI79_06465 [Nitrososphaerota archaeon]|nr:hypothetical protein [Nitrososphaerota archaeon]